MNWTLGGKLATTDEDVGEWSPVKKRCKLQKFYQGRTKLKFGLSEDDGLKSSSDGGSTLKGEVADPNQPPMES